MSFDSRAFIQQLTTQPGVYRMYGARDELLYVGKARNLKKRVATYFLRASGSPRIEAMVGQIARIEVTVTHTEDEALILEANLIKSLAPKYNVSLRDDKSYPYLMFTGDHAYPRITFHRGARSAPHRYFGPFPSASAVRETLLSLQKLFRLRPCSDAFFAHRTRPCLQHQIGRCSGPCVGLISAADYARDLGNAERLLEGKGDELAADLAGAMERASAAQDYEHAARLRDQVAALKRLQSERFVAPEVRDADVIAVAPHPARSCVTVLSVREGRNLGHRSYFPAHSGDVELPALLGEFLGQYYLERKAPAEVLVPALPEDHDWLQASLSHAAGRKVEIHAPQRGAKVQLLQMTALTAGQALSAHLVANASMRARLEELARALGTDEPPARMECFDISHTMGESTVASCVVFNAEGPMKSAYRRFNIEGLAPGDDYGAIRQAVSRRFVRVKSGEVAAPDLLFIDGGKGQLAAAQEALTELGLGDIRLVSVAKGAGRRPGLEQLFVPEQAEAIVLPPDSPALHLIQQIRDEAHRFAIMGHRGRREKARVSSSLEQIEGLGPVRRRALLKELGGLAQVRRAGVADLQRVSGISRAMAERIYAHFH